MSRIPHALRSGTTSAHSTKTHRLVDAVSLSTVAEWTKTKTRIRMMDNLRHNSVENMERFAKLHQPVCAHPGCKKNGIYMTSIKGKWTGKTRYCSLHRNEAMQ